MPPHGKNEDVRPDLTRQKEEDATTTTKIPSSQDRFNRQADSVTTVDQPCLVIVHGQLLDLTHWAKAHPGGWRLLQKYHSKNATVAFERPGHSPAAYTLLQSFVIQKQDNKASVQTDNTSRSSGNSWTRWKTKLFTNEDRYGIHKTLGIYCLANYVYRFTLMLFGDPTAGMGSHSQRSWIALLSLIPHALLSLSSLIFHTVPKERVVGKPMIWQEFRAHNIIFGLRSLVCCSLTWATVHNYLERQAAVALCGLAILSACVAADYATAILRHRNHESTTATMPYWEGCSPQTEKMFKHFYAIAQFGASIGNLMVLNPIWCFAILLPIQGASLLMTLVRKGLISTRSYHMAYLISLLMVFAVGIRHLFLMWSLDLIVLFVLALISYQLRRMGADKYALWIPIIAIRLAFGDDYLKWRMW